MKEQIIQIPDNFEIKEIKDNKIILVEKEKKLTYKDVIKGLYPHSHEKVMAGYFNSEKHLQKLIAINKLMNVAKYLNGDWQPNWSNDDNKYYIIMNGNGLLWIHCDTFYNSAIVYFKSIELAKQAIEILGEETIKLALCTDY